MPNAAPTSINIVLSGENEITSISPGTAYRNTTGNKFYATLQRYLDELELHKAKFIYVADLTKTFDGEVKVDDSTLQTVAIVADILGEKPRGTWKVTLVHSNGKIVDSPAATFEITDRP